MSECFRGRAGEPVLCQHKWIGSPIAFNVAQPYSMDGEGADPVVEQAHASQPGEVEASVGMEGPSVQVRSAFQCNICLHSAKEPVVTLCGHLYCWPCLVGLAVRYLSALYLNPQEGLMRFSGSVGGCSSRAARRHVLSAMQASGWTRWVAVWITLALLCPADFLRIIMTLQVIPVYDRCSEFGPLQAEPGNVEPVPARPAGLSARNAQVRALLGRKPNDSIWIVALEPFHW